MSDLISRRALIEEIKTHFDAIYRDDGELLSSDHVCISEDVDDLIEFFRRQPTAYDKDKVVDKVTEYLIVNDFGNEYQNDIAEIVKGGGVE